MGNQAQAPQQQVYYDSDLGQYYTQTPQSNSPFAGMLEKQVPNDMFASQPTGNDLYSNAFYAMFAPSGQRNYLNNFGRSSQALQQSAPYKYADTSLESLFPSQGGGNSALASLLGSVAPSATGSASSGAGRSL